MRGSRESRIDATGAVLGVVQKSAAAETVEATATRMVVLKWCCQRDEVSLSSLDWFGRQEGFEDSESVTGSADNTLPEKHGAAAYGTMKGLRGVAVTAQG